MTYYLYYNSAHSTWAVSEGTMSSFGYPSISEAIHALFVGVPIRRFQASRTSLLTAATPEELEPLARTQFPELFI